VRRAVVPHESAGTVELFRERARVHPEHLYLLAEPDGRLAGSGIAGLSDSVGRGFVAPRVLPDVRRRGFGTALLGMLGDHVGGSGSTASGRTSTTRARPELREAAYPLAREGWADFATAEAVTISLDDWLRDEATLPEGSFVALADGEIVGFSGLCRHDDEGVAEDGLTVVRRDWRRRGLALALNRASWLGRRRTATAR
jgi:mycothiol synthase